MTRDRFAELEVRRGETEKKFRIEDDEGRRRRDDESSGGATTNLKSTFERARILIRWIETIEENVEEIRDVFRNLDRMKINQKDLTDRIERKFEANASLCRNVNAKLKQQQQQQQSEAAGKSEKRDSAEARIERIQFETIKTRYVEVFAKNNTELENFRNIQKGILEGQLRAKGVKITDEELVQLLDNETDLQLFTDNIISETQEAKRVLADIERRHQQLLKIERMLQEIRDLFLQMAILVDSQRDVVDRVEYQAGLARDYVRETPKILNSARKKKKKYLKCKIYSAVIIVVFIVVLIVILCRS